MIAIALALLAAGTDAYLDQTRARWEQVSRQIWDFHETALKETRSSALLADVLEKEGFQVRRGVGPLPTAFVATAGSGKPVVAILAEYDALPELSQKGGEAQKAPPRLAGRVGASMRRSSKKRRATSPSCGEKDE